MPFPDYSWLMENKPEIHPLRNLPFDSVEVSMLRLDKIHPQLSGNKLFKLIPYLDEVVGVREKVLRVTSSPSHTSISKTPILTFGGPFSNHLVATAYACMKLGLRSIGIVRGEPRQHSTPTLDNCRQFGMEIHYMERTKFSEISFGDENLALQKEFGKFILIPAGGYGRKGAEGASKILDLIPGDIYTHICVSVGSATTLAGLMMKDRKEAILAFPAIKNMRDIFSRLNYLGIENSETLQVCNDYHFGGFAKRNSGLTGFMNHFYEKYRISLDIVYTSKMMYGVMDFIDKNHFPAGSRILCIHTGGLQGNSSLEEGTLHF